MNPVPSKSIDRMNIFVLSAKGEAPNFLSFCWLLASKKYQYTCMLTYTFLNKAIKTLSIHAQVLHATRGRRQELNATRKSLTVWMKSQVANQDVSCTINISIQSELALRTLEYLRTTKFVMDKSTISTCFRHIMLIA